MKLEAEIEKILQKCAPAERDAIKEILSIRHRMEKLENVARAAREALQHPLMRGVFNSEYAMLSTPGSLWLYWKEVAKALEALDEA